MIVSSSFERLDFLLRYRSGLQAAQIISAREDQRRRDNALTCPKCSNTRQSLEHCLFGKTDFLEGAIERWKVKGWVRSEDVEAGCGGVSQSLMLHS